MHIRRPTGRLLASDLPLLGRAARNSLVEWLAHQDPEPASREVFVGFRPKRLRVATRPRPDTFTYHQGSSRGVIWQNEGRLWLLCLKETHDPAYSHGTDLLEAGELYPTQEDLEELDVAEASHELATGIAIVDRLARAHPGTETITTAAGYWMALTFHGDQVYTARVRLSRADERRGIFDSFGVNEAQGLLVEHFSGIEDVEVADMTDWHTPGFAFFSPPFSERDWLLRQVRHLIPEA